MFSSLSTLIVDKNRVSRKNLISIVRSVLGIKTVDSCETMQSAVRFFKDNAQLDIVFIDHESANGATFDLIESAKHNTASEELKIVLLANGANKDFLLEAAAKGVSCFIVKPYSPKIVFEKISKLFESKDQRSSKRLTLFGAVPAYMQFNDEVFEGSLLDISSGGCLIKTQGFRRTGVEVYDELKIRIPFDNEYVDLLAELIRLERNKAEGVNAVSAGFIFKEMHKDTALQFAKLWAALLRQNNS